jgi:hypothetical protein
MGTNKECMTYLLNVEGGRRKEIYDLSLSTRKTAILILPRRASQATRSLFPLGLVWELKLLPHLILHALRSPLDICNSELEFEALGRDRSHGRKREGTHCLLDLVDGMVVADVDSAHHRRCAGV